jgi:hypothetical protein
MLLDLLMLLDTDGDLGLLFLQFASLFCHSRLG